MMWTVSPDYRWWALVAGLAAAAGCGDRSTTPPAASTAVKYVDQRDALRGLDALRLNPSFAQISHRALTKDDGLVAEVEKRFKAAGVRLLTNEEFIQQPGAAEMQIYPSVNGSAQETDAQPTQCCLANVWASLIEGATLDRATQTHSRLPVWGVGSNRGCANGPASVHDLVLEVVDRFVDDLRLANTRPTGTPPTGAAGSPPQHP